MDDEIWGSCFIKAKEISLEVEAKNPCWLMADPDKLREVICNLLHNAVQYNKPGGKIRLRVSPGADTVVIEQPALARMEEVYA